MAGYTPGQIYATPAQFTNLGLPPKALVNSVTPDQLNAALQSASDIVSAALQQFKLPLQSWGADIVFWTVSLAREILMMVRGFDPESPIDRGIITTANQTRAALELVANGVRTPSNIVDANGPAGVSAAPNVTSQPKQGWQSGIVPGYPFGRRF